MLRPRKRCKNLSNVLAYIVAEFAGGVEWRVERGRLAVVDELGFVTEEDEHSFHRLNLVLAHRFQEDLATKHVTSRDDT